jgi:hypothetical protein
MHCYRGFVWRLILSVALFRPVFAQDLFLPEGFTTAPVSRQFLGKAQIDASVKNTYNVFTISPKSDPNLCLDLGEGHGQNRLQIWQCNGHENQLWYFDSGSYALRWAGDGSKCVDAGGGLSAGTVLYLWSCNGAKQQKWGYDQKALTIYLMESETDATLCMDLAGASKNLGTAVQLWNCNDLWEQQWDLQFGITIRSLANTNFCLDLQGGKTDNGTPVQLWTCNGLLNQKWFFDDWAIRPASDNKKCIDAGAAMKPGTGFILWDCNGSPQQNFGYDGNARTIFLARSALSVEEGVEHPEATKCLDVSGGKLAEGPNVDTWTCNSCWNQQWQVIGPWTSMLAAQQPPRAHGYANRSTAVRRLAGAQDGCPSRPGPAPQPAPGPSPSPYVLSHCESSDQHNWPVFQTQSDLQSSPWGSYIKLVYGELPSTGYPICAFTLFLLYKPLISQANLPMGQVDNGCPTTEGQFFAKMSGFPATDWNWINHQANLANPVSFQLPSNKWVEIMHTAFAMDGSATWFYYTPGSGIFMWMGNTKAYNDHPDAVSDLLPGQQCKDPKGQLGVNECQKNFEDLYKAAKAKNMQSFHFTKHADMQCDTNSNKQGNYAIEIVDLGGSGAHACSQPNSGNTRFRAGWEAKSICNCDNTQKAINCAGFGMAR